MYQRLHKLNIEILDKNHILMESMAIKKFFPGSIY